MQRKKPQAFYGVHNALLFEAEGYARQHGIAPLHGLLTLVRIAAYPAILESPKCAQDNAFFGRCYAARPDDTLAILCFVREKLANWRTSAAGCVRDFLLRHNCLVRNKNGKYAFLASLTDADYEQGGVLKKHIRLNLVADLFASDIADFLTPLVGFKITAGDVKKARQHLHEQRVTKKRKKVVRVRA